MFRCTMSTRISIILLLGVFTAHLTSAFVLKEELGEDLSEREADGLMRKRMLQTLGSGYEFQAHPARVNGVRGYACSCTVHSRDVPLENCFRQMNWRPKCIHF